MGDTRDYLEEKRNIAIEEMEEILTQLKDLYSIYKIDLEHQNIIEDLIIEKGLDIVKLHKNIESLQDSLEDCLRK